MRAKQLLPASSRTSALFSAHSRLVMPAFAGHVNSPAYLSANRSLTKTSDTVRA
jgi:hypothetical protein